MTINLTLGCDPEVFVRDRETKMPVSAYGLVPGTKAEPHAVNDGAVQVDGMALEFNTAPAATAAEFSYNITSVLAQMEAMLPSSLEFDIRGSVVFDEVTLAIMPDEAKELGCDPDFNAYTMEANPRPEPPIPGLRTAAGHIHFGLGTFPNFREEAHFEQMAKLVRMLDRYLGCASVIMDPDPTRRVLYGAAGAFRVKPYGCEYRVPSNAWIKSERRRFVMYTLSHKAVEQLVTNDATHDVVDADVIDAINRSDVDECKSILRFMMGD
jgi:hypothetical protein